MVEYIKKTTVLINRCETIKKCRNPEPLSSLLREHVSMLAPQHQHHARDKTSVSSSFIIVYRWGTCGRLLHRVTVAVWNSDKKWGRNARQIASPSLASLHRCVFFPCHVTWLGVTSSPPGGATRSWSTRDEALDYSSRIFPSRCFSFILGFGNIICFT